MIDDYNKHKSEVDRFDQVKSYYSVQQVKRRTWKPLWYFLLDLTLNNCYRLSSYSSSSAAKRGGHKKFLYDLIEQLFKRGGRPTQGSAKRERSDDVIPAQKLGVRGINPGHLGRLWVMCLAIHVYLMAVSVLRAPALAVGSAACLYVGQKSALSAGRSTSDGIKLSSQQTQKQAQVLSRLTRNPQQ
ncbi:hypothetical protein BU23DRAFT_565919 [Bimuria novae-zelandiae CBS 107.79]|uniref:PiggyBac transposable element-derived protein domain-containing protein n=1 Tax=Bimuria novae-zelandiae CBS 107.79 TaxID=1447943 RepID=A0A6A5UQH7_9PLEO|nr:hypothetical protein BU23DRAFT_574490 [Bimuria novae-zelandiae CBS 107.79]KAF1967135.1 hypothetical protein BU23DRAFT_573517 [Bimuria novae-zelandiae CBS 107.79]KAF1976230.1 hypothetical protein BU23DRAFT_565919 [Bimuria novae-zelandiae CBS 107.79]